MHTLKTLHTLNYRVKQGPELPLGLSDHAMINMGNEKVLIIGGKNSGVDVSSWTLICYHKHDHFSFGPSLIQGRSRHAAGIVTDEATMERLVLVAGGSNYSDHFKSTEILKGNMWFSGKIVLLSESK